MPLFQLAFATLVALGSPVPQPGSRAHAVEPLDVEPRSSTAPADDERDGPDAVEPRWAGLLEELALHAALTSDDRFLVACPSDRSLDRAHELIGAATAVFDVGCPRIEAVDDRQPRTAVLVQVDRPADLRRILGRVAELSPLLAGWTASMGGSSGFTLGDPLVAAFVDGGVGQEEWSSEHELVHRAGELLALDRFGQLPYWVAQGLAWRAEVRVLESVYCFPYRDEFVFVQEHEDWSGQLEVLFAKRRKAADAVNFEELARLQRGSFDLVSALHAWGAVEFLAERDPEGLSRWLAALVAHREREAKRVFDDGRWEWIPDYEVPAQVQAELLHSIFGEEILVEMTKSFRKGLG